jgi:hypothetical protein
MMHKSINLNALRERNGLRIVIAISFTIFLAGLGACSTNYTPGNGQPTGTDQYGSKPHAATYGSSSGTEGSVPQSRMIVAPETITPMYSSSSEAIAVLAGHQGRFLGYANPGPASANYGLDIPTGQVISPAMIANPESTVNSSISSAPTPVITSGVGDGAGGAVVIGGLSSAATTGALTAPATASGTSASSSLTAPVFANAGSVTTPTNTALAASAGLFAAGPGISGASTSSNQNTGLLTPAMTSAATPTPTGAANPALASVGTSSSATVTPTTTTPASAAVVGSATGLVTMPAQVRFPATISPNAVAQTPAITQPVTVARTSTRTRAVSQPIAITAPINIPGRVARPVRMTTSGNGSVTITNQ